MRIGVVLHLRLVRRWHILGLALKISWLLQIGVPLQLHPIIPVLSLKCHLHRLPPYVDPVLLLSPIPPEVPSSAAEKPAEPEAAVAAG